MMSIEKSDYIITILIEISTEWISFRAQMNTFQSQKTTTVSDWYYDLFEKLKMHEQYIENT